MLAGLLDAIRVERADDIRAFNVDMSRVRTNARSCIFKRNKRERETREGVVKTKKAKTTDIEPQEQIAVAEVVATPAEIDA